MGKAIGMTYNHSAGWIAAAIVLIGAVAAVFYMGRPSSESLEARRQHAEETNMAKQPELETATFGGGCFWCTEAVFQQLRGVQSVVSGYSGGHVPNPTYRAVCEGTTGHAEVIQITFDPQVVSYDTLLEVFWKTHDPTTLNRQGNDVGTQYRSVVFYHNDKQREQAEYYKQKLDDAQVFGSPIVTEISPFEEFFAAEEYHQNYYQANSNQAYCAFVIGPKLEKLRSVFADKLKQPARPPGAP